MLIVLTRLYVHFQVDGQTQSRSFGNRFSGLFLQKIIRLGLTVLSRSPFGLTGPVALLQWAKVL